MTQIPTFSKNLYGFLVGLGILLFLLPDFSPNPVSLQTAYRKIDIKKTIGRLKAHIKSIEMNHSTAETVDSVLGVIVVLEAQLDTATVLEDEVRAVGLKNTMYRIAGLISFFLGLILWYSRTQKYKDQKAKNAAQQSGGNLK